MSNEKIHAPMACTVIEVPVAAGQAVRAGQTLLVLEAMKMEHTVAARATGTVAAVLVAAAAQISLGQVLVRIDA